MTPSTEAPRNAGPLAVCAQHPDRPATGTCARCGTFYCAEDVIAFGERHYCSSCSTRPEVAGVQTYRAWATHRKDFWAWLLLCLAPFQLAGAPAVFLKPGIPLVIKVVGVFGIPMSIINVLFFRGVKLARLLYASSGVVSVVLAVFRTDLSAKQRAFGCVWTVFLALAPLWSVRNRLFFGLPVDDGRLEAHFRRVKLNLSATIGSILTFFSVLFTIGAASAILKPKGGIANPTDFFLVLFPLLSAGVSGYGWRAAVTGRSFGVKHHRRARFATQISLLCVMLFILFAVVTNVAPRAR